MIRGGVCQTPKAKTIFVVSSIVLSLFFLLSHIRSTKKEGFPTICDDLDSYYKKRLIHDRDQCYEAIARMDLRTVPEECRRDTSYAGKLSEASAVETLKEMLNVKHSPCTNETLVKLRATKYKTCALVGNGFSLHRSNYGSLIDSFEAVARMNNGPRIGHIKDVGERTTIHWHVMSHEFCTMKDCKLGSSVDACFNEAELRIWYKCGPDRDIKESPPIDERTCVVSANFREEMKSLHPTFEAKSSPTSGWYYVGILAHMCEEIHVFGIGYSQCHPNHYWSYDVNTGWPAHDYYIEEQFLRNEPSVMGRKIVFHY